MAKLSWKTEQRLVKDLMIAEINPRKISQEQKEALTRSLEKFNLADIPVLNTDNTIISGNQRLQILYELGKGDEQIDVRVPNRKLSEAELKEYMLIANTHAGVFDVELLEAHFEDVNIDFDIQLVDENGKITVKGYERVKEGLTEDDEVPEPPKIAKSKPGQIFILGSHRLMCGDSTKKEDIELLINNTKIDMVLTDPPYGINEKGDRSKRGGLTKGNNLHDFIDDSIEYAVKAFNICDELDIKTQIWWGANYYCHHLPQSNNWIVWDKRVVENQTDTQSDCELAWVKSKWNSVRIFRHLWKGLMKDSERQEKRVHPTQKPIALFEWCIDKYECKNTVLDLFSGSGSGMIACEKMGRSFYGMELDPIYVDVIIKRWQDFTGQKAIIEATGKEFDSL